MMQMRRLQSVDDQQLMLHDVEEVPAEPDAPIPEAEEPNVIEEDAIFEPASPLIGPADVEAQVEGDLPEERQIDGLEADNQLPDEELPDEANEAPADLAGQEEAEEAPVISPRSPLQPIPNQSPPPALHLTPTHIRNGYAILKTASLPMTDRLRSIVLSLGYKSDFLIGEKENLRPQLSEIGPSFEGSPAPSLTDPVKQVVAEYQQQKVLGLVCLHSLLCPFAEGFNSGRSIRQ